MEKLYDLVIPLSKYEKDGQEKTKWENVGVIMKNDKGPFIMLKKTFNPAGIAESDRENILISMFKPKNAENHGEVAIENNPFSDDDVPL